MNERSVFCILSLLLIISVTFGMAMIISPTNARAADVAVLGPMPPMISTGPTHEVAASLRDAGIAYDILNPDALSNPAQFNAARYRLLVLPDARAFPGSAQPNLLQFLRSRGKLIACGGPAFSQYIYHQPDGWRTRAEVEAALPNAANILPAEANLATWTRASDPESSRLQLSTEPSPHGVAIHAVADKYVNWTNAAVPAFAQTPFPAGATLTAFWARGDAHTNAITVEWHEEDGSRWIAGVPITPEWQRIVLKPSDFRFWKDNSPPDRGGPGDHFHPERAKSLNIGMAQSHGGMSPGRKEFWIADIAAVRLPDNLADVESPVLESLSPAYKVYEDRIGVHPIVRYRGVGIGSTPPGVLAFQAGGWSFTSLVGEFHGAVWGGVPLAGGRGPQVGTLARSMLHGVQLTAYGSEAPCYRVGADSPALGADVTNTGSVPAHVEVDLSILGGPAGSKAWSKTQTADIPVGETHQVRFPAPPRFPGEYVVTAALGQDGKVVQSAEEPLRVLPKEYPAGSPMVKVVGGDFMLDGAPWHAVGVNFWPLYVSGQDPGPYRAGWLSPGQYDPDLIGLDLERCSRMHINEVSIQYENEAQAPALEDFLARCLQHGIRANIYLPGGNALGVDPPRLRSLITAAHLRGNPAVFAYDIAWEPKVGNHAERRKLDPEWLAWLQEQYGSVQKAEADWGASLPREDGKPTNPPDSQLSTDGPWRKLIAAYRRFIDDRISQGYRLTRETILSVDPDHLLGVRSGYGGNGSSYASGEMPYDLLAGAKHLDFISPEGYALHGDWPQFRWGGFTTAYARWAGNGKPVFWAEFGQSVLPGTPARLAAQGAYYDLMYRMVVDSSANGASGWWFPGGLRVDEHSDFGIVNPDGSLRPAALSTELHAPEIAQMKIPTTWDASITVDRDRDARGYAAVWEAGRGEYVTLREASKTVEIRTAGTGTTTANMPLTAVGGGQSDGHGPLQYANAEINSVKESDGPAGKTLTISVGNTGEAAWTATGPGRVGLLISPAGTLEIGGDVTTNPQQVDSVLQDRAAAALVTNEVLPAGVPRYGDITLTIPGTLNGPVFLRMAIFDRPTTNGVKVIPFGEGYYLSPSGGSARASLAARPAVTPGRTTR